jgi:hypothetical protein
VPTREQHIKKARENEAFAGTLDTASQASLNWKLVAMFYTAVHYIEAYLAKQLNQHLRSHTTRDNYVARESNLRNIRNQYSKLKYYGYNARYEPDQFTDRDVKDAIGDLAHVKATITLLL